MVVSNNDVYILGISAFYHDSAAALIKNGEIIAAAHEERFTRKKQDSSFPVNAIKFCLDFSNIEMEEVDSVVFYDKPFKKFERLLETYYSFSPRGLRSFLSAIPVWIKEKLFLKELISKEINKFIKTDNKNFKKPKLLFSNHHLSHAGSAFYPSPFQESAILTIDGVGEWATASIAYGKDTDITTLKEMSFPNSLGFLYSAFTYFLGFKVNSGEYKLMGLAPYGNPKSQEVQNFKKLIKEELVDIKNDGSLWLNQDYFDYCTGLKMIKERKWRELFGFKKRNEDVNLEEHHCNLALAIQQITDEVVLKMAKTAKDLTGSENLCMAGGVALNCVSTSKILKQKVFKNMWIQPAAGDAGGALGAALAAYYIYYNGSRKIEVNDSMKGSYLGPEYDSSDIKKLTKKYNAPHVHYDDFNQLIEKVAALLAEGNVVGWFQGRMEWGPRALGNRSILGDPRNSDMQKQLNLKIKFREGFRPFAPSVLEEMVEDYFEGDYLSPYMLLVSDILPKRRRPLPSNFYNMTVKEKLYYERSDLPSITHMDYSARLQTVNKNTNPRYWQLINKFKDRTGYGVVVNTSFNVRGEPIVCTPKEAYICFMKTEMDYLVLGDYLFEKGNQPLYHEKYDLAERSYTD